MRSSISASRIISRARARALERERDRARMQNRTVQNDDLRLSQSFIAEPELARSHGRIFMRAVPRAGNACPSERTKRRRRANEAALRDTGSRFDFRPGDSPYPKTSDLFGRGSSGRPTLLLCESTVESDPLEQNVSVGSSARARARTSIKAGHASNQIAVPRTLSTPGDSDCVRPRSMSDR